ncbi:hypothetical protein E4T39_08379 [Aureobasidium subglaciale]|nr:hypothetical protein E4T39_08379 [Aureobasidium subglaciale]
MYSSSWTPFVLSLLAISATAAPALEARKNGGATKGGPASAKVTIYSKYECTASGTAPPTDGSAGTATTFSVTEAQCTIPNTGLQYGGALTAVLTATPKSGTAGCYVLAHSAQGCGLVLGNEVHGWPFAGVDVGNAVGCGEAPYYTSWSAFEILCE